MARAATVTLAGRLTKDPDLRTTHSGVSVCSFGVAVNRSHRRDGEWVKETDFFDVEAWGQLAENVSKSTEKGTRVMIEGELRHQVWHNKEGQKQSRIVIRANDVAASMMWAQVEVTKVAPSQRPGYNAAPHPAEQTPAMVGAGLDNEPF